jgi:hypothetical protein
MEDNLLEELANLDCKIAKLHLYLREEKRIKRGVDYAIMYKYEKMYVSTTEIYKQSILEAVDMFGLTVYALHIFE